MGEESVTETGIGRLGTSMSQSAPTLNGCSTVLVVSKENSATPLHRNPSSSSTINPQSGRVPKWRQELSNEKIFTQTGLIVVVYFMCWLPYFIIASFNHQKLTIFQTMIALNSAIEVDLTGQVCSDSIGLQIYSGFVRAVKNGSKSSPRFNAFGYRG